VLAARPGHTRATLRLAECLLATGDGLHAAHLARDVVRGGGGSNETLLRAGRVLYFARQYSEAAAAFAHVIDDRSRAAVARLDLAFTCAQRRDYDRFNAHCDRALALHEGRALAAAAAGNAAKASGNQARHEGFRRLLWRLHQHRPVPPCCFTLLDASFGTTGRPIEYLDGFDRTLGLTKFLGFAPIAGSLTSLVPVVGLIAYLGLEPAFDALYRNPAFETLFATVLDEPA
jgi:tetratricopeptide (TPR) repeat protein